MSVYNISTTNTSQFIYSNIRLYYTYHENKYKKLSCLHDFNHERMKNLHVGTTRSIVMY